MILGSLPALAYLVVSLVGWALDEPQPKMSSAEIAEEFVALLKLGEDVAEGETGHERRIGYADAYELLSTSLREEMAYDTFYRIFHLCVRDHGPIMASERLSTSGGSEPQRGSKSRRSKSRKTSPGRVIYRLLHGTGGQNVEDMAAFDLRVALAREGTRWVVGAFDLSPAPAGRIP